MSEFLKNKLSIEKSAKSKAEAVEAALKELGLSREEVEVEVLDEGSKGFLGLGARDARVAVTPKEGAEPKISVKPEKKAIKPAVSKSEPKAKREPRVKKQSVNGVEADAVQFLSDIFKAMNLEVEVSASLNGEDMTINLSGENMGIVIGKRGDTLDSLQYLTSLVVNQRSEDYIKVSIDTENYREKRTEALLALSARLADKVTRTGKRFTLEPMNPYERRIIHSSLQDNENVTTYSVGNDPYRKVVIAPKGAKPYKKDGYKKRNKPQHQSKPVAEKTGSSYTTTYKADFKPQQHKAEFKSFDDYLAAHSEDNNEE